MGPNPFSFERFGLTSISLSVDNINSEYMTYTLRDTENLIALNSLITEMTMGYDSLGISRTIYATGYMLFAFRIFGCEANEFSNTGNLTINMNFTSGCTKNATAIILGQTSGHIKIDNGGIQLT